MTAKEKAKDLVYKFYIHSKTWDCFNDVPLKEPHSVHCALIAVDEILIELNRHHDVWDDRLLARS